MLLTTRSKATVSPAAVSIALARPCSAWMRVTSVLGRSSTPSSSASFVSATGTARVPPMGYHTPSFTCMLAMPHKIAGLP